MQKETKMDAAMLDRQVLELMAAEWDGGGIARKLKDEGVSIRDAQDALVRSGYRASFMPTEWVNRLEVSLAPQRGFKAWFMRKILRHPVQMGYVDWPKADKKTSAPPRSIPL